MKARSLGLIAILSLLLSACAGATPGSQPTAGTAASQEPAAAAPKILKTMVIGSDLNIYDPMLGGSQNNMWVMQFMFDALVRYAPGKASLDALEPDLSERWETSPDGLTWTFTLKKGVQFHKGYGELTSSDVKFSFERQLDKAAGGAFLGQFSGIQTIDTPDPSTVRIVLKKRDPFFLTKVANYGGGFIVSKKAVEALGDGFRTDPVGTGPFEFKAYTPTNNVQLKRNDSYFRGKPNLDEVQISFIGDAATQLLAFKAGDLHVGRIDRDLDMIADLRKAGFTIHVVAPIVWSVHMNPAAEPRFADIRVRQALMHCTDRTAWAAFYGDLATPSYLPGIPTNAYGALPTSSIPQNLRYDYDPAKARELLAQAGYPNGLELSTINKSDSVFPVFGQIAQEQWQKCGIKLNIRVVDKATYDSERSAARVPLMFDGGNRIPIADIFLREWFHSKAATTLPTGIKNHAQYGTTGRGIDAMIDEALGLIGTDDARAIQLYRNAQLQILEDAVAIPLVSLPLPLVRAPSVDLGYEMEDSLVYNLQITEKTDLKQ